MKKDDLRVESYNAEKVTSIKLLILRRVAAVGGAIALLWFLLQMAPATLVSGGSGSWFVSVLENE